MMPSATPVFLADAAATCALAACLAAQQPETAVVYLSGDLGAGKSTLARAWLRALGVTGPIRSPTYTLVEPYAVPGGEALHLDLYRLGSAAEWEELGLDAVEPVLWLIEWPERAQAHLPHADLHLHLALAETGRSVRTHTHSARGAQWWQRARTALAALASGTVNPPLVEKSSISGQ